MEYKKNIILITLTVFLFSIAGVCASDVNDTSIASEHNTPIESAQDNILKTDENNEILTDNMKTFTQLDGDINASPNKLEVKYDYKFTNESDSKYIEGIVINESKYVIEGNGHTIDGNNQSRIFRIDGNDITINNLNIVNGNSLRGGAMFILGNITLNNVTFINNTAKNIGGAIAASGQLECNNSKFIDNYVNFKSSNCGAAMALVNCEANILNTEITSKIHNEISQIVTSSGKLNMDNVTFANLTSTYAPALQLTTSCNAKIRNSKFINLTADKTAGAIAIKTGGDTLIENCEFINITSSKNAGAIYADISGSNFDNSYYNHGNLTIINSQFENTYSGFGGALIQLGGKLVINNTKFIDGTVIFSGGSVYISFVDAKINNCSFNSNIANYGGGNGYGGAIFSDYSDLLITNSSFINNSANFANAIYALDTSYNITNSTFINNSNAVFTDFDRESYWGEDNRYDNQTVSFNNTFYSTVIYTQGIELTLANNNLTVTNLPSRYDSRDWGWVSEIKNQRNSGSCWTFGMTGALESALRKACEIKIDFSQNNMRNTMIKYSPYGCKSIVEEGMNTASTSYLLSWFGALPQEDDSYDEFGKISPVFITEGNVHIHDIIFVSNFPQDNGSYIKEAIFKYGSIDASFYGQASISEENPYYNPEHSSQYVNISKSPNHEISIIGWDDNYPKENFLITPPGDGAWIIKNSYGKDWGENGIVYVSYYDKNVVTSTSADEHGVGIILENTIPYNKNYQNEILWLGDFITGTNISSSTKFTAIDDDLIAGVGTYFEKENLNYTIEIYVNNELKLIQNGVSPYYGYHTVKLDKYIPVKMDDVFYVVFTSDSLAVVNISDVRTHHVKGISFIYRNGEWSDLYDEGKDANLRIYTVCDDTNIIDNENITVDYGSGEYFSVKVITSDGHSVGAGEVITFTINGKNITVPTDDDGIAKFKIDELPRVYDVTTTYNNQTYKNNVNVKLNLNTCKVINNKDIKVDYSGGSYFTVKVVSADGKVVASGASVIFKINGKTITVKTDKNGIAKVKITDVPKKYTMITIFNGKSYKNTVTVKQVLTAKKVTVKKTAKKFTLTAKLKINGKLVKGKTITFNLNGKTYKVKTNKKGIAKKILKKNVIKKFKKGKTYTLKVTYLKDTIKTKVKVK